MAGEWIPVRVDLFGCPQVVQILSKLCPECVRTKSERVRKTSEIVGALVRMWSLFDRHTDDGELIGYTTFLLDDEVGIEGFSEAVVAVGWLSVEPNALKMPEFSKYLSASAKTRMKDAQRKREERAASRKCPENVQNDLDKKRTTEEKRIEEKRNTKPPKSPKGESGKFDPTTIQFPSKINYPLVKATWAAWCQHRKEIKKPMTESAALGLVDTLARMGPDLAVASMRRTIAKGWQGLQQCPPEEVLLYSIHDEERKEAERRETERKLELHRQQVAKEDAERWAAMEARKAKENARAT